ncbi:MAG: TonB C-terminal domain-containing protein [Mariprofundaceae bacterium]
MKIKTRQKRFSVSFTASVAAHLLLALFVTMNTTDNPLPKKQAPQIMDVVLLDPEKTPSKNKPKDAKAISNRSAEGSSKNAKDRTTRSARSPAPGQQKQQRKPTPPQRPKNPPPVPPQQAKQRTKTLARRNLKMDSMIPPEPAKKPTPRKERKMPQKPISMANLMPSTTALAQLSRDFEREKRMKQLLSKEADIPINTREAKFAPYAQSLVRALEEQWRPGQANYRDFSEDDRRVLMRVTIEHNGALGGIEILRPSKLPQVTESAIEAIHASAPFKPLPSAWGLDRANFFLTFEVIEDRFVFKSL